MEDDDGAVHLKGLSLHRANTEEEALNLLFLGDTNRAISETPMNQASSRSHCVFTMGVERREAGSDTVRRAKVNLVRALLTLYVVPPPAPHPHRIDVTSPGLVCFRWI